MKIVASALPFAFFGLKFQHQLVVSVSMYIEHVVQVEVFKSYGYD